MYAGFATKEQAEAMVHHIFDEETFASLYGVTTLAKDEKMFDLSVTNNPSNWLGPIWLVANYIIFKGLLNYGYKEQTKKICKQRKELLYENLIGLPLKNDSYSTNYYDEYDLLVWARMKYGEEFAQYLKTKRDSIEFLFELAEKHRIVLLNGSGFEGPSWSIRVSLANLYDEQYVEIGKGINGLFDEYAKDWKNSKK